MDLKSQKGGLIGGANMLVSYPVGEQKSHGLSAGIRTFCYADSPSHSDSIKTIKKKKNFRQTV